MRAYKVFYDTSWSQGNTIVLVNHNETLEEALKKKINESNCAVLRKEPILLSSVLISQLSITEFIDLMKEYK